MSINSYSNKDYSTWKSWKNNPTEENLGAFITQVQPLIKHSVSKMYTGNIPRSALDARATSIVIDSLPKFDPNKSQLNTYLTWQLKQLNRYVYKHQNLAKIPESRIVNIGAIKRAEAELRDKYGCEPSLEDVADYTKIPLSQVRLLDRELRKDISADFMKQDMFKTDTSDTDAIYTIWADSSGQHRQVLEYLYGLNNKPKLSLSEISEKLGITPVRLSQIKNLLGKKVLRYKLETMPRY